MAIYSKKKLLAATASQIPQIGESIKREFELDDFEVNIDKLMSGGLDISITKGNVFKAVLGMRSALKISLMPQTGGVLFDANVGIYGQQAIPSVISMFFFWPVLITQIWGLVEQSQLDDRALEAAERACGAGQGGQYVAAGNAESFSTDKFCIHCGAKVNGSARFCPECGEKL